MNIIKIGNKWINLELVTNVIRGGDHESQKDELSICFGDFHQTLMLYGIEAKALAQLLDNNSRVVQVEVQS